MNTVEFLELAAQRIKFTRKKYDNQVVPSDLDDIIVVPFFGDIKHICILSSFILNNYKRVKSSKYIILLSYPGFDQIFPYVDEYWQPTDYSQIKQIFFNSNYFENKSEFYLNLFRSLNENFRTVLSCDIFKSLYNNKFQESYWTEFGKDEAKVFVPMIPSSAVIQKDLIKEINSVNNKIFISPSIYINSWSNGKYNKLLSPKSFYIELIKNLINNKIFPIIWNNNLSYDLQDDFKDKIDCLFVNSNNLFEVLPAMRLTGCVLDIFNSLSRLANIARTPSIILEERNKYFLSKEYEIDDLLDLNLPGSRVFSFSSYIFNGNKSYWESDIFKSVIRNCEEILPFIDRENLPSTSEINKKINLSIIRRVKNKKMGTKFLKIPKLI